MEIERVEEIITEEPTEEIEEIEETVEEPVEEPEEPEADDEAEPEEPENPEFTALKKTLLMKQNKKKERMSKARDSLVISRQVKKKKLELFEQYLSGDIELTDELMKSHGFDRKPSKTIPQTSSNKVTKTPTQAPDAIDYDNYW
jgi:hypothetical protein